MYTDQELIARLAYLGIDGRSYRALALLPLIQVAWADGKVQPAERALILKIAKDNYYDMNEGERLLASWLEKRPSDEYLEKARELLVALAQRERGLGSELGGETLAALLDMCTDVAKAAGGVLGFAFTVDRAEREAIRAISEALSLSPTLTWSITTEAPY
jgi:uncharacterized tellurite resistance protein B-like protein